MISLTKTESHVVVATYYDMQSIFAPSREECFSISEVLV